MARDFVTYTTVLALGVVWAADQYGDAFASGFGRGPQHPAPQQLHTAPPASGSLLDRPAAAMREALGVRGLAGFGMGFGLLVAAVRMSARASAGRQVARRAADIEVAEKTEAKPIPYFESLPRSIVDKKTLDKLLSTVPKEQWEDPPEDSYLYTLKCYAETYGEGKATKMGWWDFWYMRINMPDSDDFFSGEEIKAEEEYFKKMCKGGIPMEVPGPAGWFSTGAWIQWKGKEPFAGDQCQTPVTDGAFAKQWLANIAWNREGLKPWQRGIEIGMAHGYFIIGPFVSLGPLRNTPEAATAGLLAGAALIGIVSVGGLLFGATIKPKNFDRPGSPEASGFQELINWHAIGGLGGAGFAHALLTVFGS